MRRTKQALSILLSLIMVLGMFAIVPITVSAQTAITYTEYSWNGSALVMVDRTVTDYTVVNSDLSTMTSGNYVVSTDTTIENYVAVQKGSTANLIVPNGVTLTCSKGIGCGYDKNNQAATLNIYGTGKIVATGKSKAAGIGGDDDEANGNITIHGTTIEATGGKHGAGIGGGEGGKDPDASSPTITIYDGNITATGGIDGAGIGGGRESDHIGGEGGTCYIGGGSLKVFPMPDIYQATPGHDTPVGTYNSNYGETIGRGYDDPVSGTVIYSYNGDFPSSVPHTGMKVKYAEPGTPNDFKIAKAGDRSTKSHAYYILDISECDHKDLSGKSVLTYTIDGDKHTEKCKYCNYKATVAHHGSDCECGYQSDTCIVHIFDDAGLTSATVARNGQFELPDNGDRVQSSNTNPKTYYRVTGWLLSGDTSGKVYENGEVVTVDGDMTFTSVQEDLYQVSFDGLDHGSIHADITNNEAYAAVDETLEFGVEADPGYSVSKVTYKVMAGFEYDNDNNIVYQYSAPIEIQPVDGKYQLTMPAFTASFNNRIVISAEFSGNTENPICVSDSIENGTVTSDKETAAAGATVTLTAAPDDNYRLDKFNCRAEDGSEIELTKVDDTQYTFTMPAMSVNVSAEFELADDFTALQAIIDSTASGGTVTLALDYTAREDESCLTVPAGKTVTIDLNGYDIDRNTETPLADGNVITNSGTLTITGNGNITGGNSTANGGAILNNGTLTISTGVTISYNSTTEDGGAIYNSGMLTINGGTISNNISAKSGGAISAHKGTITINGGEIKNNRANSNGGAIYFKDAVLNLYGGTITGNTVTGSDSQGGGICDVGTLNVSGNPVVKNNTAPAYNKGYNIYLRGGKKVNVTGELTNGAEIGVTAPGGGTGDITSGLSGNGTADSFFSDNPDYYVDVNGSGEGTLAQYFVFTFDANGGTGEQETIRSKTNRIDLPACTLTAPEGKIFKAWSVGGTETQPGETATIESGYAMTVTAVWADAYHIEIEDGIEHGTVTPDAEYAVEGQTVTLTATPEDGYVLQELYVMPTDSDPIILNPEAPNFSFTMPAQDVTIHAYFAKGTAYVDAKGNDMPAKIAQELVSSDIGWGGSVHADETTSWYCAEGEVTINERVTVSHNVNLILCDGATLTIPKGIKVAKDTSLTIWQQKGRTGHLVINSVESGKAGIGSDWISSGSASDKTAGTITINGGILGVRGGLYAAAIGGGRSGKAGSVTINGGNVNATANWYGAAIGRGHNATYNQTDTVTINGGTVKAIMTTEPNATSSLKVMNDSTFTLNYTDESKYTMSVMAESWSGSVTLSKKFVDEDGTLYNAQTVSDNSILDNKTLRPYDGMGVHLAGHTISLQGDIAVNFYMQLDPELASHEGVKMQFTVPDTSAEYQYQEVAVSDDIKVGDYYVFKCRVAAKDMDSVIQAQLIDGDNKSTVYTYSVKEYADYLLDHTNDNAEYAAAAPLVRAMLAYGDNARYYFDKNGTVPAEVDATIPEYVSTVHDTIPDGVTFSGATLSLKSQTTLSLYFESNQELSLTCPGYTTETAHSGREYVIRIRNIAAKDLDKDFTVKVNGAVAVTYSPLAYCYKAQQTSSNAALVNTVKALYLYWVEANQYFNRNQGGN